MNDDLENQMNMLQGIDFDNLGVMETTSTLDLGNIPNQPVQPVQPVQPTVQATPDMNAAPVFVSLGENTTQTKTNYLKLKENESTRVTILNYNAVCTHFHYESGLGYFKCLSQYDGEWPSVKGVCCLQPDNTKKYGIVGKGKTKIFLPVIEYPVNYADGKTVTPGKKPELKVLALNNQEFQSLYGVQQEYGVDTSAFDLSITRKRSDKGGFLEYRITPGPSWRNKFSADIQVEAAKVTNETYNLAIEEFARTLSPDRVKHFYAERAQADLLANQIMNQQVPGVESLGLQGDDLHF